MLIYASYICSLINFDVKHDGETQINLDSPHPIDLMNSISYLMHLSKRDTWYKTTWNQWGFPMAVMYWLCQDICRLSHQRGSVGGLFFLLPFHLPHDTLHFFPLLPFHFYWLLFNFSPMLPDFATCASYILLDDRKTNHPAKCSGADLWK